MNKAILMGRLTRDPEIRCSQGAEPITIARYTLAVDRRGRKGQDEKNADFINCVAFRGAGDFAEKYFRQGMRVLVSGRIQTGSYTNKDGQKVRTTEIIVEEQEFADSKNANAGGNNQGYVGADQNGYNAGGASMDGYGNADDAYMDGFNYGDDEGLPFN